MSIATLIRRMSEAGAPPEAIALAVEEIEALREKISALAGISPLAARINTKGKVVRRKVPKVLRAAVIARDGNVCTYCSAPLHQDAIHLDHRIPISRGGQHTLANLCVSCGPCNHAKSDRTADEFAS